MQTPTPTRGRATLTIRGIARTEHPRWWPLIRSAAVYHQLTGYARACDDGSITILLQGERRQVGVVLTWFIEDEAELSVKLDLNGDWEQGHTDFVVPMTAPTAASVG
ncbi:MAG TPA: acylphosphatase [Patescibacteria group bacterium]|nr:acylphosphatase [Patescibacteria group bacterium]